MWKNILYDWNGLNLIIFKNVNISLSHFPTILKFLSLISETGYYKNILYVIFSSFFVNFILLIRERYQCNRDNFVNYFAMPFIKNYFLIFLTYFSTMIIIYFAKEYFDYIRPICNNKIIISTAEHNYALVNEFISSKCDKDKSFPSAHSVSIVLVTMYIWQFTDKRYIKIWLMVNLFLVGISRIAPGYHFPADVVWGYIVGAACFWSFYWITNLLLYSYEEKIKNKIYNMIS